MQKKFPPTAQQQQIIQSLLNSQDKGKHFFQLYFNNTQTHTAINAFSLLPYQQMIKVTSSLAQLQTNNSFNQQQTQLLNQCYRQCQQIQSSLWMIDNQKSQRGCNSICMLMCLGIFVSCIFSLWEMIFVTSSADVIEGSAFQPVLTGNSTSFTVQKEMNFVYLTEMIVYIGLKMVSGFWALFGCLLSTCCLCGCVPQYFKSVQNQYRQKRRFKERIIQNRKFSQLKININDTIQRTAIIK